MNKTVIITGATKGIGKATAELFLKENYHVIGTGRSEATITHKFYEHHCFDVGSSTEVTKFFTKIADKLSHVVLLLNNAGLGFPTPMDNLDLSGVDEIISTNINGVFYMANGVIPTMINNKKGHIINISSVAGKDGFPTMSAYCASKYAVTGLTQSWYKELRPHGIKVTSIHPGSVNTNFFDPFDTVTANDSMMKANDIASSIWHAFNSDANYHIVEIEMRPLQPK